MEARDFEKVQKNPKIFKIPKTPKIVPKSIQTCFEQVLGQTFRKFFAQFSMEGRVFENFRKNQKVFKISKTFKITKKPKIVPKSIQTCFEQILGQTFRKLFAQFSMEGRVFENFQKNKKKFKTPKTTKIVPKSIQTCFELALGQIFRKFFCPVFHGRSSLPNFSKQSKNLQNSKSAQNRSQKYPNVF